ncbi:hypothetical protein BTH42_28665 [Burkholderia sp. SRS-W-2-2016]|uniref:acyltransferase family protein n=1 Tax=Burkholderia sp. SRS-W-2-2016 TaxID=1926878 RepID=UPI00094AB7D7|nr:acyltransferase [Burkholderia sp. SRS-W-2-2016]OLL28244.1 hypothetical protein BTH42_28665 [Burkholderia sp. SRS-W-2-2016]
MSVSNEHPAGEFSQLNALRGIAAVTVVMSHFTVIDPLRELLQTPLRFLLNGHNAVIMFFLISGFVLTLQLTSPHAPRYREWLIKRICRIYLPYLAVFSVACAMMSFSYRGPVSWAGVWANIAWDGQIEMSEVVEHVVFVGTYRAEHILPVIWTLIYEMRIAFFFPLLVCAVQHLRACHTIALALVISAVGYLLLVANGNDPYNANLKVRWELTAHFAGIFVAGAALAQHRTHWLGWLAVGGRKAIVFSASLAFYFFSRSVLRIAPAGLADFLFDWGVSIGAAGLISVVLSSRRAALLLAWQPAVFMGRISYSLYLTHTVVLLTVIHLMPSADTALLALAVAAVLVTPVAALAHFAFEKPAIVIGRALTR